MLFLSCIMYVMFSGRSLQVKFIMPLRMLCLSAQRMMFVNVVFAVGIFDGG